MKSSKSQFAVLCIALLCFWLSKSFLVGILVLCAGIAVGMIQEMLGALYDQSVCVVSLLEEINGRLPETEDERIAREAEEVMVQERARAYVKSLPLSDYDQRLAGMTDDERMAEYRRIAAINNKREQEQEQGDIL